MGIRVFGDLRRLAASRPHEFLSERGELFRPRSGQASNEVEGGLHLTLHFNFQKLTVTFPIAGTGHLSWFLFFIKCSGVEPLTVVSLKFDLFHNLFILGSMLTAIC